MTTGAAKNAGRADTARSAKDSARSAKDYARSAKDSAEQAGDRAVSSRPFRILVTVGLITYGIVHILVGWIAVQIAWGGGGSSEEASQQGALAEMTRQPVGVLVLWLTVVGLFAMTVWQAAEAGWGHRDKPAGFKRIRKRLSSVGRAVSYAAIAVAAITALRGTSQSGDQKEEGWTARLMALPFGRILVIAVGVIIIAIAVRLVVRGINRKFAQDLTGVVRDPVLRLGQIGYVSKGIAFALVGGLFCWAALTYDPSKAGGLDDALRTINSAPLGSVLLTVIAIGLVCFGIFCFIWAWHPKIAAGSAPSIADSAGPSAASNARS
ncbi:MAG TPA: DUF1206 domain-containing protein [Nakamurella sp.]